jgi:hypothetical protein
MEEFQFQQQWLLWTPRVILFEFSYRNLYIFCYSYPSVVEALAAASVAVPKMIATPPCWLLWCRPSKSGNE